MRVKVEQINEYLFSDTVQSQKTKSGTARSPHGRAEPDNANHSHLIKNWQRWF